MNIEERNAKLGEFFDECKAILISKGADYNPTGVAFDDLAEAAKDIGRGPIQVLWIYMSKHISAIRSFVRKGDVASEPIRGRLIDLSNYCAMLAVLQDSEKRKIVK
jgi:hypothetical protein